MASRKWLPGRLTKAERQDGKVLCCIRWARDKLEGLGVESWRMGFLMM